MRSRVVDFVEREGLLNGVSHVVVGVSGGIDSMVMVDVLRGLEVAVTVVHVNYGLRKGAEADEDLVRSWCETQTPPLPVRVVDAAAEMKASGGSVQEAARRIRYAAFAQVAGDVGAKAVAVGHHRDDQAETLLLNLLRGSGPEGLAGMPPSRPLGDDPSIRLIRPLLTVRRADVRAYAEARDLPWRSDPSNQSTNYRRGLVRTKVLPLLEAHVEGAAGTIARAAELMREYVEHTLTPSLRERFAGAFTEEEGGGGSLDVSALQDQPPVWRRRLVLEALERTLSGAPHSRAVAEEIAGLVDAQVGRHVEFDAGQVWRERGRLRFVPATAVPDRLPPTPVPLDVPVSTPGGELTATETADVPDDLTAPPPTTAYADARRLQGSLTVRSWEAGDRFQPLGMNGTKLVSDLLTDAGVPPHWRASVCVVTDDAGIVWVAGHRLAHRTRVRPDTKTAIRFDLERP